MNPRTDVLLFLALGTFLAVFAFFIVPLLGGSNAFPTWVASYLVTGWMATGFHYRFAMRGALLRERAMLASVTGPSPPGNEGSATPEARPLPSRSL